MRYLYYAILLTIYLKYFEVTAVIEMEYPYACGMYACYIIMQTDMHYYSAIQTYKCKHFNVTAVLEIECFKMTAVLDVFHAYN